MSDVQRQVVNQSVFEPLEPLVMAGYRSLASRAVSEINEWYSGVGEAAREGCEKLPASLKGILKLAKIIDTVSTGKRALTDNDAPYSDAIGLAELVG